MGLLIRNSMEKMRKIPTFSHIGILTPLYEEKSTIVDSNTITVVKIKMKKSELLLVSSIVTKLIIFSLILRNRIS
jgi:hypothetical protein